VAAHRIAADEGDAEAQFEIACLLTKGEGCLQDFVAAAHYFHPSADQGHAGAQYGIHWGLPHQG